MDFPAYYSGEKIAPIPTLFVGGNHECSSLLSCLPHGGWVAKNIYYMGYSGVVNFGGARIGGLSGIYKSHDATLGHWEKSPFAPDSLRSVYHARDVDAWLMQHMAGQNFDFFLSHDWPNGVAHHGDLQGLLRRKAHLEPDIRANQLGSPQLANLLHTLAPQYWFSAHLHCQFAAMVPTSQQGSFTRFLALDKPIPGRRWLQMLSVPRRGPLELSLDPLWAAVLAARLPTVSYWSSGRVALPPVVSTVVARPQGIPLPQTLLQVDQTLHLMEALTAPPAATTTTTTATTTASKSISDNEEEAGKKRGRREDPNEIDLDL